MVEVSRQYGNKSDLRYLIGYKYKLTRRIGVDTAWLTKHIV